MAKTGLITGQKITTQIKQAARLESEKSFYQKSCDQDYKPLNRSHEVREQVEEKLRVLHKTLQRPGELVLYVVRRNMVVTALGHKGIEQIRSIPAGEPDPEYPVVADNADKNRGHGGILASPRIMVKIDNTGPLRMTHLDATPGCFGHETRDEPLEIPLYDALHFADTPEAINPLHLPTVKNDHLRCDFTTLTIGDAAVEAHIDQIMQAVGAGAAPSNA